MRKLGKFPITSISTNDFSTFVDRDRRNVNFVNYIIRVKRGYLPEFKVQENEIMDRRDDIIASFDAVCF